MRKRLFILTNSSFPFGNANSNYIRMFAKSVLFAGWQVIVLGCGENPKTGLQSNGLFNFDGIQYNNIKFKEHILPFSISGHLFYGKAMAKHMKQYNIDDNDYIYIYSAYWNLFNYIKKEYEFVHHRGHLIADCVEWFQPWQYRFGVLNPEYQLWKYNFEHCITKYKKVIPISNHLKEYFESNGCKTLIVPPLVDSDSIPSGTLDASTNEYHFMYSGAATNKDSIDIIIRALAFLEEKERKMIKLHFTTLSEDTLISLLHKDSTVYDRVKMCLVFHGWLEYSELLNLYKQMDFLVLFRQKNTVTISNFPSKVPEMMNYGIVPVCSDVGDYTNYYLTDQLDSIFVRKCTAEDGAEAFRKAISLSYDDLIKMKEMSRKCAREKFDYRVWSSKIVDFLEA